MSNATDYDELMKMTKNDLMCIYVNLSRHVKREINNPHRLKISNKKREYAKRIAHLLHIREDLYDKVNNCLIEQY
ncbi:MAG: hypothetical protein V3T09_08340 [bacterium]